MRFNALNLMFAPGLNMTKSSEDSNAVKISSKAPKSDWIPAVP